MTIFEKENEEPSPEDWKTLDAVFQKLLAENEKLAIEVKDLSKIVRRQKLWLKYFKNRNLELKKTIDELRLP